MKKSYKFLPVIFFAFLFLNIHAQTNVSGGIYSNTTWTKANSPYNITDSVVVFPGVTLTIEPGVTVNIPANGELQIRQATLIAIGNSSNNITFTGGYDWYGIYFNGTATLASEFNFCNFYSIGWSNTSGNISYIKNSTYSGNGPGVELYVTNTLIDSCTFKNNYSGLYINQIATVQNCVFQGNGSGAVLSSGTMTNCIITGNKVGVYYGASIKNCIVNNNEIGIEGGDIIQNCQFRNDSIGIEDGYSITDCIINNNNYGISDQTASGPGSSIKHCTIDSNSLAGIISYGGDSILFDEIKHNPYGIKFSVIIESFGDTFNDIHDTIFGTPNTTPYYIKGTIIDSNKYGIVDVVPNGVISCNKICDNTIYNLKYENSNNFTIPNNYWCTTDSLSIRSTIYDGYINASYGLVNFTPIDTSQCYLSGCNLQLSATTTSATCDTCHTGSATVNVTNGASPFTYTWYTSPLQTTKTAVNVAPGTYAVCVVDANGCSACYNSVFVDSTNNCNGFSITTNGNNSTCSTCNDGGAWVNVTGGTPPYAYTWYTSPLQSTDTAAGLLEGSYSVCVNDKYNCSVCDSVSIGTGNCSAHFEIYPDTTPHDYLAKNMASGVPPLSYLWSWGDSTTSTGPYPSHTYDSAGYYTICLTITDSVGCTNTYCVSYYLKNGGNAMVMITVLQPNGISTGIVNTGSNLFSIFPNPAFNTITLAFLNNQKSALRIYNILGEQVFTSVTTQQNITIDISNLAGGVYLIEAVTGNTVSRQKFVKGN